MALLDKLKIGGTVYDAWATKDQVGSASDASSATTVFGKIKAVFEHVFNIAQFFGVTPLQGYEFGTPTEIIDELKDIMGAIDQEATLPNSVTIDGTTYSGTSNS